MAGRVRPDYDFRVGIPDALLFPLETWRRLVAREMRRAAIHAGGYGEPAGHPAAGHTPVPGPTSADHGGGTA